MVDPLWINEGAPGGPPNYDANELRAAMLIPLQRNARAMGAREGVRPGGTDLFVSLVGSDIVAEAGGCVIDPAWTTEQAPYWVAFPTQTPVDTLDPADATDPRVDRVWARIYDHDHDASGRREAVLEYEPGVPGVSPVPPAIPQGAIPVARIEVPQDGGGSPVVVDEREECIVGPEMVVYTASGTFEKADYPWARKVRVQVWGSGGGGGGSEATASGQASAGNGGSAGGYAVSWLDVSSLPSSVTVTVGAGGVGAAGVAGGAGAPSSFGGLVAANGGAGGSLFGATANAEIGVGTLGGIGTVGQILARGNHGAPAFIAATLGNNFSRGGDGGSTSVSVGGRGGRLANGSNGGDVGANFGGGGGGGASGGASAPARSGGDGASGAVIVEVY